MYDMETKMLLKHYLEQGVSKAELARRFQLSRRTIHYWIESGQLDRELQAGAGGYVRRSPVAHKLDPYKGIVEARLEVYPKLTAQRLYEEVRAAPESAAGLAGAGSHALEGAAVGSWAGADEFGADGVLVRPSAE